MVSCSYWHRYIQLASVCTQSIVEYTSLFHVHFLCVVCAFVNDRRTSKNLIAWAVLVQHYELFISHHLTWPPARGNLLVSLLWLYVSTDRAKEAEMCYRTALHIKPDHVTANTNMGHLCRIQRRWKEAIKHYTIASQRRPNNPILHYHIGNALIELGGNENLEVRFT